MRTVYSTEEVDILLGALRNEFLGASLARPLLLDARLDSEISTTSNVDYVESIAEYFEFFTSVPNQEILVSVSIPLTVHQSVSAPENGAFRVYIDGDGYAPNSDYKQWNGLLVCNGGAWCHTAGVPVDGRCTGYLRMVIPTAGQHVLRTMFAGSKTYTIGTLRGRRVYQVW